MSAAAADVVIVGGGGVGSAVAYFLTAYAGTDIRVVVCERDPTYAHASTTLAAGGIRQQFSTPENVLMSQFGLSFVQTAASTLAVGDDAPEMGLRMENYLRLLPEDARAMAEDQVELQRSLGANPRILEREGLGQLFPWMNVADIAFGVLGGGGEGAFDPHALLQAFRRKSISQGATFKAAEVVGFERDAVGRICAVTLSDGGRLACGAVVNAAGPGAGAVSALAGLDLPVQPLKAQTLAFRAQTPIADFPVVLDRVAGLNIKAEGALFLAAWPRKVDAAHRDDFDVDYSLFDEHVWPALAHRVPAFEAVKLVREWIGHLEWNLFDGNPVIGPHPDCDNFIFANGFSGHGLQHIPAVGRAIAELLVWGRYQTLDLSRFGYQRLRDNSPLHERI